MKSTRLQTFWFDRWFNYDFIKIWVYCAQLGFFPFCGRNDNSTGIAHPERLFQIDDRPEGTYMKKTGSGSGGSSPAMAQWVELISEWALFQEWDKYRDSPWSPTPLPDKRVRICRKSPELRVSSAPLQWFRNQKMFYTSKLLSGSY